MDKIIDQIISQYKCMKCDHKWEEVHRGPTLCPKCSHLYVKWLNYEELYEMYFKDECQYYEDECRRKYKI